MKCLTRKSQSWLPAAVCGLTFFFWFVQVVSSEGHTTSTYARWLHSNLFYFNFVIINYGYYEKYCDVNNNRRVNMCMSCILVWIAERN